MRDSFGFSLSRTRTWIEAGQSRSEFKLESSSAIIRMLADPMFYVLSDSDQSPIEFRGRTIAKLERGGKLKDFDATVKYQVKNRRPAMDLIRHTLTWIRGEILEMTVIAVTGVMVAGCGVAFGRFGTTPLSKAMVTPLVIVGLLYAVLGLSGLINNQRRIPAYETAFRADPAGFARSELKRVGTFDAMYRVTNIVAPLCFAIAAALFWLTLNPQARAIGIALVVFGLYGFLVDGFSKERADAYRARISEALTQNPNG